MMYQLPGPLSPPPPYQLDTWRGIALILGVVLLLAGVLWLSDLVVDDPVPTRPCACLNAP